MPQNDSAPLSVWSLARSACPLAAFYGTGILIGLTDLAVVGALGTNALAAVGLGKTILFSLIVIGFAVLSIGTVLMAEQNRAGRRGTVLIATLVATLPFITLGLALPGIAQPVLAQNGYSPVILQPFEDYTGVLALAVAPALGFAALKNVLVAAGHTRPILFLSILTLLGNAAVSILLVHGIGDWKGMGVAGAAWATVAMETTAMLILAGVIARHGYVRMTNADPSKVFAALRTMAVLGWAAGAQQLLESGLFIVVLYLLGLQSPVWLAAGVVAFAVMELNFAVGSAIGEVGSARIAAFRAERDIDRQRRVLFLTTGLSGAVSGVFAVIVWLFPGPTIGVFSSGAVSPEAQHLMERVVLITAPFFLFDSWQIVMIYLLRGLRRTLMPLLLSTACYWGLGIGGGLVLADMMSLGGWGIWIGFCAGLGSAAMLLAAMTRAALGADVGDETD